VENSAAPAAAAGATDPATGADLAPTDLASAAAETTQTTPTALAASVGSSTPQSPAAEGVRIVDGGAIAAAGLVAVDSTPTLAQSAPASAPQSAQAERPLAEQLSKPLVNLRAAGDGTHVMTLSITPDSLGPVTVRAHVTGGDIRIELITSTDQARESLKAILPDLRRDLAVAGTSSTLNLSSTGQNPVQPQNSSGHGSMNDSMQGSMQGRGDEPGQRGAAGRLGSDNRSSTDAAAVSSPRRLDGASTLDVLA
jgi:flagellar hook-length control protein FliK